MWIMLIKKLPVNPSPPKLSIHWSTPWIDMKFVRPQLETWLQEEDFPDAPKQFKGKAEGYMKLLQLWASEHGLDEQFFVDENGKLLDTDFIQEKLVFILAQKNIIHSPFGSENNWAGARKIHYKDQDIRIFPDEFSVMDTNKMNYYLGMDGEEGSHELVPGSVADATLVQEILAGSLKEIFDAAMVDGCTPDQATAMAFGIEVSAQGINLNDFPAIGWYRCKKHYAVMYCTDQEMKE